MRRSCVFFLLSLSVGLIGVLTLVPAAQAASPYYINGTGGDCAQIGTWDGPSLTCTLNQDLTDLATSGIYITASYVTLDGAGYTLSSSGGNIGVDACCGAGPLSGVNVKNLNINGFTTGIKYDNASSTGWVMGNVITGSTNGITIVNGSNSNSIVYNTIQNTGGKGLDIYSANNTVVQNNNFIQNTSNQVTIEGTSTGSSISSNYYDNYDSPAEGCFDAPYPNLMCDAAHALAGGSDPAPWTLKSAWSRYDWTWYDNTGGDDWVLLGNKPGDTYKFNFGLNIAGMPRTISSLPGYGPGYVPGGKTVYTQLPGLASGPVSADAHLNSSAAVASQRILWPKGGSSLEEIPGSTPGSFDSQLYWPWYDATGGYQDWIMVSNPNSYQIHYSVKIGDVTKVADGIIPAGEKALPSFPGIAGGPVQVKAWNDSSQPVRILASQRVLSNGGSAFNEVVGTNSLALSSDDYVWPWYDQQSPGALDWIMISNPTNSYPVQYPVYYEIWVGGIMLAHGGPIPAGSFATPSLPGVAGGPLEVKTFSDAARTLPEDAVVSQRSVWGPSFEEVPGKPKNWLGSDYYWTWYDQNSPGALNWVMVANPGAVEVTATVSFTDQASGTPQTYTHDILPGRNIEPWFPGKMGGPVHVSAVLKSDGTTPAPVIATQRVLWNNHFNEVWGQ